MSRSYVPDIARFGVVCEANYVQLCKLLSRFGTGNLEIYSLYNQQSFLGQIQLLVKEASRYTNLVLLEQIESCGKWLNNPRLMVRMYHDARMAEVVNTLPYGQVAAVNTYPNKTMHLPDEKHQLNQFLAEWLSFCIRYGHSPVNV